MRRSEALPGPASRLHPGCTSPSALTPRPTRSPLVAALPTVLQNLPPADRDRLAAALGGGPRGMPGEGNGKSGDRPRGVGHVTGRGYTKSREVQLRPESEGSVPAS